MDETKIHSGKERRGEEIDNLKLHSFLQAETDCFRLEIPDSCNVHYARANLFAALCLIL